MSPKKIATPDYLAAHGGEIAAIDKKTSEPQDSAVPAEGQQHGAPMGDANAMMAHAPYYNMHGYSHPFMYPSPYMTPMNPMMWPYPPDPFMVPAMGMPMPNVYHAPKGKGAAGKGWSAWGNSGGGKHKGGKGLAGRGQRGSPGCGNSVGKGRNSPQEVAPQSTLNMTPEWRNTWKLKLEEGVRGSVEHEKDVQDLLEELRGSVWEASQHKEGCHVVQLVMVHCTTKDWAPLVKELHTVVWDAVEHQHANFVLQTLIESAPIQHCRFIITECMDRAVDLAKHRYGCRILCRIAEHCLNDEHALELIQRVLECDETVKALCCHNFAHHVTQQIMEKGLPEHRKTIAVVLSKDLIKMAQSRHASYIIEAAFEWCELPEKQLLKQILLQDKHIIDLAKHQFGGFVVKKLAGKDFEDEDEDEGGEEQDEDEDQKDHNTFKRDTQRDVQELLRAHRDDLMNDKNGKKVFEDIFPTKGGQDPSAEHNKDEDKGQDNGPDKGPGDPKTQVTTQVTESCPGLAG